jgi:dihydrofolate reductase
LILTRQIADIAPDPRYPNAFLWNPRGATLDEALERLGVNDGTIAVIGGPEVFSLFLPLYDAFHLSHAAKASIPGGIAVFTEAGPHMMPEDVLRRRGFRPGPRCDLDKEAGVSVVTWESER